MKILFKTQNVIYRNFNLTKKRRFRSSKVENIEIDFIELYYRRM